MTSPESNFVPVPEQNGPMAHSLVDLAGLTAFGYGDQSDIGEAMAYKGTKKTKFTRR